MVFKEVKNKDREKIRSSQIPCNPSWYLLAKNGAASQINPVTVTTKICWRVKVTARSLELNLSFF